MGKRIISKEEEAERKNFWKQVWSKPVYVKISNHIPKFLKSAGRGFANTIQRIMPGLTKAGGDAATNVGMKFRHFNDYSRDEQEDILAVDTEVTKDSENEERTISVELDENVPVPGRKAPFTPVGKYNTKEDFIQENDVILFTAYLSKRLELDLCYILKYDIKRKPQLKQMLNEAVHYGFIGHETFKSLDKFRFCRNEIIHECLDYELSEEKKRMWVEAVFSLEEEVKGFEA